MTSEELVAEAERDLSRLKRDYISHLQPVAIRVRETGIKPTLTELLKCQQFGNEYFNYLETFVGRSGLLGAHDNGKWVTGFAETCHSVLNAYINHINFLRSYQAVLGNVSVEPDAHAFANMQRMVKEYLSKESASHLEGNFSKNRLPTSGFIMPAHDNVESVPVWQIILSAGIGVLAVVGIVILSVAIPNPTEWQSFVFRGCLALGLAAVAVIVPGFLSVKARVKGFGSYFKIVAGGAIAIFVLIWLINPPQKSQLTNQSVSKAPPKNIESFATKGND